MQLCVASRDVEWREVRLEGETVACVDERKGRKRTQMLSISLSLFLSLSHTLSHTYTHTREEGRTFSVLFSR